MKAGTIGGVEAALRVISTHDYDYLTCFAGCSALWNMSYGNTSIQKEVCEKGGTSVLLRALKKHLNILDFSEACCAAIGTVISSLEAHTKLYIPEATKAIEECYEKHKDSEKIKHFLLSLKRRRHKKL